MLLRRHDQSGTSGCINSIMYRNVIIISKLFNICTCITWHTPSASDVGGRGVVERGGGEEHTHMANATEPKDEQEMARITSPDGTEIAYERSGSGPPLVLVHGSTVTHTYLNSVCPGFADHFTVYAIDRRGHGESSDTDEYALEREAEDVAAIIDFVDDSAVLFGVFFGAHVSLEAALRTDNLRALILYEPWFAVGDDELYSEDLLAEMKALDEGGEYARLLVLFNEDGINLPPEELDALRSPSIWPGLVEEARTLYREAEAANEYEFEPARFAEMTTPTALLMGNNHTRMRVDFTSLMDELHEALPDSRIVILEGQGHHAVNTAPDLVIDEILSFVRESI